jgi:hypothetical protein
LRLGLTYFFLDKDFTRVDETETRNFADHIDIGYWVLVLAGGLAG